MSGEGREERERKLGRWRGEIKCGLHAARELPGSTPHQCCGSPCGRRCRRGWCGAAAGPTGLAPSVTRASTRRGRKPTRAMAGGESVRETRLIPSSCGQRACLLGGALQQKSRRARARKAYRRRQSAGHACSAISNVLRQLEPRNLARSVPRRRHGWSCYRRDKTECRHSPPHSLVCLYDGQAMGGHERRLEMR